MLPKSPAALSKACSLKDKPSHEPLATHLTSTSEVSSSPCQYCSTSRLVLNLVGIARKSGLAAEWATLASLVDSLPPWINKTLCCWTVAPLSRVSNEQLVQAELECYHAAVLNIPWPIFQVALLVLEWDICRLGGFSLTQMEFPYTSRRGLCTLEPAKKHEDACPMRHTLSQE